VVHLLSEADVSVVKLGRVISLSSDVDPLSELMAAVVKLWKRKGLKSTDC
jgi:hypothetical protein